MMKSERGVAIGDRWRLQDAKARFSEVVKRAREHGLQRVTLHRKDAAVIISAGYEARRNL